MALLNLREINKKFGGIHSLNNVSLTIGAGEIYGLIGPNGAGKTTLFNVILVFTCQAVAMLNLMGDQLLEESLTRSR